MWHLLLAMAPAAAAAPPPERVFLLREAGEPALSVHHEPRSGTERALRPRLHLSGGSFDELPD